MNKRRVTNAKYKKVGRIKKLPGISITHDMVYKEILNAYLDSGNYIESITIVYNKYDGAVTISQLREACMLLSEKAKDICENIFSEIFFKHSLIYSAIARQFETLGSDFGQSKAMLYRERLLGLIDDTDDFFIENEFDFIEKQEFDINLLNKDEKIRFEQLLLKTKGIEV